MRVNGYCQAAALAVVLVSLAVGGRARADGAPPSSVSIQSLPPGLWFRPNHYEGPGRLEKQPPEPSHAAIAGLFANDGAATRAVARVLRSEVDLGFPWVVENHELQLPGRCREAIVVVAALFATEGDARIWRQADARRRWLQIVPVAGGPGTRDCGWQDNGHGSDRHGRGFDVVYVDPAASAPGYPVELGEPDHFGDRHGELNTSGPPVCRVRAGTVHSFRNRDALHQFGRYLPARCGTRLVYVPIEYTLRSILIERLENGETLLHQLTDVACDVPNFDTWRYTRTGRKVIPERPPTFTSCCAG